MKHKWAKEIKAWADGAEIEMWYPQYDGWGDCLNPMFDIKHEYRIKPQPTHEDIMKEHYREMAKKALAIPEISEAVDRLFEAFAEKEPQYLYVYADEGGINLSQYMTIFNNGTPYIGKIKLEQDDE